ncbi:hypothetical protein Dcar01_03518 [Deinococcus carri]|uniref:Uncharacterized protein n=1 Tax=Deinococcus carri TaxID=1211323 RepID=A0ABP9WBQ6_9DEIO
MRKLSLFTLSVLVLGTGLALAQGTDLPSGIPAEYQGVVAVLIGLLSAVLVQPLTSIAKKLGRTTGPTTVAVSAVLSLLVALGFALAQAAATRGGLNLGGALLVALVAFVKANGDYITRVFSNAKGNALAPAGLPDPVPVVVGEVVTPPEVRGAPPASGLEVIPGLDTTPGAARGLLGGGTLALTLDALLESLLSQAGLQPTPARLLRIGGRLAVVAPDLLDGDAHLSADSRNRVLGVILELKQGGLL